MLSQGRIWETGPASLASLSLLCREAQQHPSLKACPSFGFMDKSCARAGLTLGSISAKMALCLPECVCAFRSPLILGWRIDPAQAVAGSGQGSFKNDIPLHVELECLYTHTQLKTLWNSGVGWDVQHMSFCKRTSLENFSEVILSLPPLPPST